MITRPDMGERVTITAKAYKVYPDGETIEGRHWARQEFDEPLQGIYIGYRFVYAGEWVNDEVQDPDTLAWYMPEPVFKRTGQHELWLVVTNPRHNPIYVWPDDVTKK